MLRILALPLIERRGDPIARGFHDQRQGPPAGHLRGWPPPGGLELLAWETFEGIKDRFKVPIDVLLTLQQWSQGHAFQGAPIKIALLVESRGFEDMKIPLVCF